MASKLTPFKGCPPNGTFPGLKGGPSLLKNKNHSNLDKPIRQVGLGSNKLNKSK